MKFDLDCDYFNRTGDKVKYVGKYVGDMFLFRYEHNTVYPVRANGQALPDKESCVDILGKWEITDDPDKPKKIKPMDILDGTTAVDLALTFKINELIASHNKRLDI